MLWEPQGPIAYVRLSLGRIINVYLYLISVPIIIIWILSVELLILYVTYLLSHLFGLTRFGEFDSDECEDGGREHSDYDNDN